MAVTGVIFIAVGLGVGIGLPVTVEDTLSTKLEDAYCKADSSGMRPYDTHNKITEENSFIYRDIYLFNVTNPGTMLVGGKPKVTESSRYRYRISSYHVAIDFPQPGTYRYSLGEMSDVDPADVPRMQSEYINGMSGGYLTAVSTVAGEQNLALGLSGCSTACLVGINTAGALAAAGKVVEASAMVTGILSDCSSELAFHGITISDPTTALVKLSQLAGQCVNIGTARLSYHNCLDGGFNSDGNSDYTKCAAIAGKAFSLAASPSFAAALTAEERISGLVVSRTAGELTAGYASSLQGLATFSLRLLPTLQTATINNATATTPAAKAAAAASLATVDAQMSAIEAFTKSVCDGADAIVTAGAGSTDARAFARAGTVKDHCTNRPCTKATRLLFRGIGCFGFTPGYAVNTKSVPTTNLPKATAEQHASSSSYLLNKYELGNGCGGDLERMGKFLKFNDQSRFVAWPTASNVALNHSSKGFPTMAQLTAGAAQAKSYDSDAKVAGAQTSGDWMIEEVNGYNTRMSPSKLFKATSDGYKPYKFKAADYPNGGDEELRVFVTNVRLGINVYTGSKLKNAMGGTGAQSTEPYPPNDKMQVKIKKLKANRFGVTGANLDAVIGGSFPAGHSGMVSLAYSTGFPSWLSLPLFLGTAPAANLTENIEITRSDGTIFTKAKSQVIDEWSMTTYFDIEPITGATINGHNRLMASFAVPQKDSAPPAAASSVFVPTGAAATDLLTPAVRPMVPIPVYMIDEHSTISDDKADTLAAAIVAYEAAPIVLAVFTSTGALLALWAVISLHKKANKRFTEVAPVTIDGKS